MNKLVTVTQTREIVQRHGFKLTKSLGQNFLVDRNILDKIVQTADVTSEDIVIEIGTGIGTLTYELAQRAKRVIAIEIDKNLIPILEETLAEFANVTIINEDILKVDLEALLRAEIKGENLKVVANLPYYITTPIIMRFLESGHPISDMVLMVQKEVAARIAAQPGTKDYGSLTVAIQYYATSCVALRAPKGAFFPPPNVDSGVIHLQERKERAVNVEDERLFGKVVRGSFSKRRKTLLNALSTYEDFGKEEIEVALKLSEIDPKRRGETLTIEEFARLTNTLTKVRAQRIGGAVDSI